MGILNSFVKAIETLDELKEASDPSVEFTRVHMVKNQQGTKGVCPHCGAYVDYCFDRLNCCRCDYRIIWDDKK